MTRATDSQNCPCLSGDPYAQCCGRFHSGQSAAPTAESLMRSRYSAFALGNADYLRETWHPNTRPADLDLDSEVQWRRLDILATHHGGPLDTAGVVEFKAYFRDGGDRGSLHETSRFVRENRRWFYVDGQLHA